MEEINEENLERDTEKKKIKNKIILISSVIVVTLLLIFFVLLVMTVGYSKIYDGISVNGIKIGGMSIDEAKRVLSKNYENLSDLDIEVVCNGYKNDFTAGDINATFNVDSAVDCAYLYGRDGNIFEKINTGLDLRFSTTNLNIDVVVDRKKVDSLITKVTREVVSPVVQPSYVRQGNSLIIKTGVTGVNVDTDDIRLEIIKKLTNMEGCIVQVKTEKILPGKVDIDKIGNEISKSVQNAEYINDTGNLVEQIIGVEIEDVDQAKKIAESVTDEGMQFSIPLLITLPEVTTENVLNELFKDKLSVYTTYFNVNEKERSENVRLASEFINDVILMPGQEFSYNTVVGERSLERGFKTAKVYQQGQVVDGLGGGICQVSSTLYNAAVMADLEIVERRNHSLSVAYVKLGRDATVVYGTTDFRFKNTQQYPIKITSQISGGSLTITIYGYNVNPKRSVDIETETIEVLAYSEKEITDTSLPEGTSKIIQAGKKGYKVKSYRVTKENGKIIERKLISTDTYAPIAQIKKVGI